MAEDNLYRCTLCDNKVEKSGRYGHVKFSDGDGHGPKGEVPEDADDYFVEADSPLETDGDDSKADEDSPNKTESEDESTDPEQVGNSRGATDATDEETGAQDSPFARLKAFLFSEV